MIQLFFAYFYDDKKSGLFLGLSALTRYTNISYFITSLLRFKKPKKLNFKELLKKTKPIIIVVLIASLVISPWLLFNWIKFGDPLFSIIDQYANNIGLRGYLWRAPQFFDFIEFFSYSIFLLPACLFLVFKRFKKVSAIDIAVLFSLIFEIYSFIRIPLRSSRYLFVAVFPLAYFITKALQGNKWSLRISPSLIIILNLILFQFYSPYLDLVDSSYYDSAFLSLDDCMVSSNAWVYVNYLGIHSEPYPPKELINKRINEGYRLLFYKNVGEPEYIFNESFMNEFNIIEETSNYYLLGNLSLCKKPYVYDLSYLQGLNRSYMEVHGIELSYTLVDILG
jgi:hypothetical protein